MKTREEWLEQLPIGWRIAFGNQLADDVIALAKNIILKMNMRCYK